MAEERDKRRDEESDEQVLAGQQSQASEYGEQSDQKMGDQGAEGSFGGESAGRSNTFGTSYADGGGMSGQPIGGNDSKTGSGTTLSAGYTPATATQSDRGRSDKDKGETIADRGGGIGTGGSAGGSSGEGFMMSQGSGTDDELQRRPASSEETNGAASPNRADESDEESDRSDESGS